MKEEYQKKWWYRLLKVVFISLFLVSVLIPIAVFFENKPTLDRYNSRFSLRCDDGRIRGDFDGSDLNYNGTAFTLNTLLSSYDSYDSPLPFTLAKVACYYQETGDDFSNIVSSKKYFIPDEKNFEIIRTKTAYLGSWTDDIFLTIIVLVIIVLCFSLVRAVFFYIFFKGKFWKSLIWRDNIGVFD